MLLSLWIEFWVLGAFALGPPGAPCGTPPARPLLAPESAVRKRERNQRSACTGLEPSETKCFEVPK